MESRSETQVVNDRPAFLSKLIDEKLPLMIAAANGPRAIEDVATIVESDRWNSFDQFKVTHDRVARAFEKAGAKAEMWSIPTGGQQGSGRWVIQEASDVRAATLEIVSPMRIKLADFKENPWHVIQWSAATDSNGVTGPIVVIDNAEELSRLKSNALRGKILLTKLSAWDHHVRIANLGALAMISDAPVAELPDAVAWTKYSWGGTNIKDGPARLVGFALSQRQGEALRKLIAEHKTITVCAKADIVRYTGTLEMVSGIILGKDDPQNEIWAVAHSAEPGALDNASGVACCVEIVRILKSLIDQGKLPVPKRTIRFLIGYECYSFFDFLEHQQRYQAPMAGVCLDTVGAIPEVCKGHLRWHATVSPSASFVDDLGEEIILAAMRLKDTGYQYERQPFVTTEDTLLGDPKYGFPCPWLTNHPFRGYHSSADTMRLLHAPGMEACAAAMAAYLYCLADAGTEEATQMAEWFTRTTINRTRTAGALKYAQLENFRLHHEMSMERLQRWFWGGNRPALMTKWEDMSARVVSALDTAPRATFAPNSTDPRQLRVPVRCAPLCPTAENTWGPDAEAIGAVARWTNYFADGEYNIQQISELISLVRDHKPEQVSNYFEMMERLGYVKLYDPFDLVTETQLVADLKALGVKPGMDLIVHSSLSKLGPIKGGAKAVVRALLAAIVPGGTLLAPSFNHFDASPYNALTTPTRNGAIPDAIWRHPNAKRSDHPSHALAAIGPKAEEYLRDHAANGIWAENSPIGRLVHGGGYVLALGVTHDSSTAYHIAEISLNVPCLDQFGSRDRVVDSNGVVKEVSGLAWRAEDCPVPTSLMDETLDARGLQSRGKVGRGDAMLVKAHDLWTVRREHLKDKCPMCAIQPEVRK